MPGLFGGNDSSVSYSQSPQQQQMFEMLMPTLAQLFGMQYTPGTPGTPGAPGGGSVTDPGSPLFGESQGGGGGGTPATPGSWAQGDPWQAPAYGQPTADWYSNLSPDIMAGLQQPYMEAQQQGMELLGGSAGSARGGATGAAGAMTGDIMGQMARNVPMQAWQMGAPGRAAEYQSTMLPYTGALAGLSGTYPEAVVSPGSDPLANLMGMGTQAALMYSLFSSSEILKENIEPMKSPIEKIEAIRGVDFDWKNGDGHDIGVIAEEVEKVIPEAVIEVDGIKHVYYHKIIPLLVESIKAQQLQIDALSNRRTI